jgi:hypothetical protein
MQETANRSFSPAEHSLISLQTTVIHNSVIICPHGDMEDGDSDGIPVLEKGYGVVVSRSILACGRCLAYSCLAVLGDLDAADWFLTERSKGPVGKLNGIYEFKL